jgi:hypothetical protein
LFAHSRTKALRRRLDVTGEAGQERDAHGRLKRLDLPADGDLSSQAPEHKSIVAAPHEGYWPNDSAESCNHARAEWGGAVSAGMVNARAEKTSVKLV